MRNLIEESKQKSTNFYTIIDGTAVPNYVSLVVKKEVGEKTYYWHIQRALESAFTKHYICCEVYTKYSENRRSRIYDTDKEFEEAIERIGRKVN